MSKIIESVDDVKILINNYEFLEEKAEKLVDDEHFDEIVKLEWSDDDLTIYYTTYYKGCIEHLNVTVPIEWLFLSDDELEKEKKKKKEDEKEIRQRQKELNEIIRKQAQEQKEREEYERLRTKYGCKKTL